MRNNTAVSILSSPIINQPYYKMNVFYDSTIFSRQTFGGISRYFIELINHLPTDISPIFGLRASDNMYLGNLKEKRRHLSLHHIPDHKKLCGNINRYLDRRIMNKGNYDLIHITDYNTYFLKYNRKPSIVTVHDLIHKKLPSHFKPAALHVIEESIVSADYIIAISETTRRDLTEHYGIAENKIKVIYHGYSPIRNAQCAQRPVEGRYILFVGERGGYKNFTTLLEAFSKISESNPDLKLICTGRSFTHEERKRISAAGVSTKVMCKLFPTEKMSALYSHAECFVFPSKMEGFGMPILEAYAAGTAVAVSNTSCLPEIAGEGALYFNPDDSEEMAKTIGLIIGDRALRQKLIEAGTNRLKQFSWEKCASETAEVYRSLLTVKQ